MEKQSAQAGFTLIEVLIVAVLLGVFGALAADTLTNIMKAQNKVKVLSSLNQSGSYALSRMEQEIRKAEKVTCCQSWSVSGKCKTRAKGSAGLGVLVGGQEIYYLVAVGPGSSGQGIKRVENPGQADESSTYLTNLESVSVKAGSVFNCSSGGERVTIQLELEPAVPAQRKDFEGSVDLETTVLLRGKAY